MPLSLSSSLTRSGLTGWLTCTLLALPSASTASAYPVIPAAPPHTLHSAAIKSAAAKKVVPAPLSELTPLPPAPRRPAPPLVPFQTISPTTPLTAQSGLTQMPARPAAQLQPVQTPPVQTQSTPKPPVDPLYAQQWNLSAINVAAGWAVTPGQAITVAVLDTGYVDDPELKGRLFNGYDFVSDPERAGDGNGYDPDASGVGEFVYHGEVVANIIAAAHDGVGMAGINPKARVVAVRVVGQDGMIAPQDLINGMRWAAGLKVAGVPANPRPARIINLSLYADFIALTGCDTRIQAAIDEVVARNVLIVAGAANDRTDAAGYTPAGCRGVITVAATNREGTRSSYSNFGANVALSAPGGEPGDGLVLSGLAGRQTRNGTSFSAPQVSGVASLMIGLDPTLTPQQVTALLRRTARPFASGCDPDSRKSCGAGLLDAGAALKAVEAQQR
ncbi:S8 family serine peptidase [Deinococcus sp.]|uniref:S8 family serine peptidase n=1 Tax=Deinococcus sp. TaxID=47478 RepID=UPI003B5B1AEF